MSVAVKWKGMQECRQLLQDLQEKVEDPSEIMHFIGAELVTSTQDRIKNEKKSPDGVAWQPLSKKYAQRKAKIKQSAGLLELSNDLVIGIIYQASATEVIVGSSERYAQRQQFGGGGIPARPYLGISAADNKVIVKHIRETLADL